MEDCPHALKPGLVWHRALGCHQVLDSDFDFTVHEEEEKATPELGHNPPHERVERRRTPEPREEVVASVSTLAVGSAVSHEPVAVEHTGENGKALGQFSLLSAEDRR